MQVIGAAAAKAAGARYRLARRGLISKNKRPDVQ